MKAMDFEQKRLAFIEVCERNCSCDSGRCNSCHMKRAGLAAIEAAVSPPTFEDMFSFYEEAAGVLGIEQMELQKKLHPALKKLFC